MPDLLLELFCEEIPARMQRKAAEDLKKRVTDALVEQGFLYEGAKAFSTPRRLALHIAGLPARGKDVREERKGPRVGSPDAAIQGFLKAAGLSSLDQATIESDPKKGEFYVAVIEKPGRETLAVLAETLPKIIREFPWPKSMRWGAASAPPGAPWSGADAKGSASLRWVRPLQSILCTFGPETEEPEIVPFEIDGIVAGNITQGHRFMAPGEIRVKRYDDYVDSLQKAFVVLDAERRKEIIRADAATLAFAQGLEVVEDEALLDEVSGLVEWPVVLMGSFEEEFLDVPQEVIRATIRANQKCFVLRQSGGTSAALANRFLLTANIEAKDEGKTIIAGNERVIRARLSDAKFFWETDKKNWAADPDFKRLEKFKAVTFHEKLGSQWERIERIRALAKELCAVTGADATLVDRAVTLCKADLLTEVVGEFPEVQGLMGRIYATLNGENPSVAAACAEHYKPVGPSDSVPSDKVAITVALADKLDTLVGFWAIDEKPTGSKDPYALRRAALGVIRLVVENGIALDLWEILFPEFLKWHFRRRDIRDEQMRKQIREALGSAGRLAFNQDIEALIRKSRDVFGLSDPKALIEDTRILLDLISFFHDRLKVMLREQGARHDLVDAVLVNSEANDDLLLVVRRVEALGAFLDSEDGASLLAGFRRAANILRAEEKKENAGAFEAPVEAAILTEPSERTLLAALGSVDAAVGPALERQDFSAAMRAMAGLRAPVDAFFEAVMVNAEDKALRLNRLRLLAAIRRVTARIADFSMITG